MTQIRNLDTGQEPLLRSRSGAPDLDSWETLVIGEETKVAWLHPVVSGITGSLEKLLPLSVLMIPYEWVESQGYGANRALSSFGFLARFPASPHSFARLPSPKRGGGGIWSSAVFIPFPEVALVLSPGHRIGTALCSPAKMTV